MIARSRLAMLLLLFFSVLFPFPLFVLIPFLCEKGVSRLILGIEKKRKDQKNLLSIKDDDNDVNVDPSLTVMK